MQSDEWVIVEQAFNQLMSVVRTVGDSPLKRKNVLMMLEPTFRHAWKRLTQEDGVNEDVVGRRLVNRLRLLLATEIGDAALIAQGKVSSIKNAFSARSRVDR